MVADLLQSFYDSTTIVIGGLIWLFLIVIPTFHMGNAFLYLLPKWRERPVHLLLVTFSLAVFSIPTFLFFLVIYDWITR